jgi:hypothetical protein
MSHLKGENTHKKMMQTYDVAVWPLPVPSCQVYDWKTNCFFEHYAFFKVSATYVHKIAFHLFHHEIIGSHSSKYLKYTPLR